MNLTAMDALGCVEFISKNNILFVGDRTSTTKSTVPTDSTKSQKHVQWATNITTHHETHYTQTKKKQESRAVAKRPRVTQ